jgi:hypothetical protein
MTAVDQTGRRLVRYRSDRRKYVVHVNPSREVDNAMLATICLTISWLGAYFATTGG